MKNWISNPSSKQTSTVVIMLILATSGVLLYDAAHQDFPAEGVSHPSQAAAADGWVVALDTNESGELSAVIIDVESGDTFVKVTGTNIDGNQSQWGLANAPTEVLISENHAVVWQGHIIKTIRFDNPLAEMDSRLTEPLYEDVILLDSDEHHANLFTLLDGEIYSLKTIDEEHEKVPEITDSDVELLDGQGNTLAWVTGSSPLTANLMVLDDVHKSISVTVNATSSQPMDDEVEVLTGAKVDYANATITGISFDENHLIAEVNLSAVTRLVLVDLESGDQRIIGDPLFPVSNPSVSNGLVAWQHQQFLTSLEPTPVTLDWDVAYHVISQNQTYPLHVEDDLNQTEPQVMKNHIVWLQDSGGEDPPEVRIYALEETIEQYSSRTLQVAIILLIPLLTLWMIQKQRERLVETISLTRIESEVE
ncbi:MAG: hypothetical protein H8D82_01830 [Euryarchaeota archaeon]|nr:hypothetical protein [Euryarchaeota archaeon]